MLPLPKCFALAVVALTAGLLTADEPPASVKEITTPQPGSDVYDRATRTKPLALRSAASAARYYSRRDLDQLTAQVDFDRQYLLVFSWEGSSRDRLIPIVVGTPNGEELRMAFQAGRTRDLRRHVVVYAVRSNVKWTGEENADNPRPDPPPRDEGEVRVELRGLLDSRVVAIGGETTGVEITAEKIRFELDFAGNANLRRLATQLHGQKVVATGKLTVRQGIERRNRWIVQVERLRPAAP